MLCAKASAFQSDFPTKPKTVPKQATFSRNLVKT
jgi:hypothetical protein